jgi:hypothetical protein
MGLFLGRIRKQAGRRQFLTANAPCSIPGQSLWDLWRKKLPWDTIFSEHFRLPLSITIIPKLHSDPLQAAVATQKSHSITRIRKKYTSIQVFVAVPLRSPFLRCMVPRHGVLVPDVSKPLQSRNVGKKLICDAASYPRISEISKIK